MAGFFLIKKITLGFLSSVQDLGIMHCWRNFYSFFLIDNLLTCWVNFMLIERLSIDIRWFHWRIINKKWTSFWPVGFINLAKQFVDFFFFFWGNCLVGIGIFWQPLPNLAQIQEIELVFLCLPTGNWKWTRWLVASLSWGGRLGVALLESFI